VNVYKTKFYKDNLFEREISYYDNSYKLISTKTVIQLWHGFLY